MSSAEAQFKKATDIVQNLPKDGPVKPSTEDQLFFYGHYKQGMLYQTHVLPHDSDLFLKTIATIGDINTSRPGMLDFVGKVKWDAWKQLEGTTKEDAMKAYVKKLLELLKAAGDENSKTQIAEIENAA
ncbi:hypothetical protein Clacol_002601 [Clathrus columnatus]|uniref:ACB domain-containing protein n=1 Tax=Clathrus columnatus TaxID=1419009 RepID=A0AAV5A158_9AGAM|nr:hypothetical protein Clacol_002601 [Clathrus columnatus]